MKTVKSSITFEYKGRMVTQHSKRTGNDWVHSYECDGEKFPTMHHLELRIDPRSVPNARYLRLRREGEPKEKKDDQTK